jgi:O-antigen/teichoic acid export membrane protein
LPKLYFRLKEKANSFVLLSFSYFLLSTILIIWFIVIKKEGAFGYLKGQLYASVLMTIIYIYISLKIINITFDFNILLNLLKFTIPFIPPLFISWFLNQSNRIFLENSDSLESVGIFSFANKISMATSLFTTALMVSFEPNFYKYAIDLENGKKKIYNFLNIFILIAILSSFILILFSKEGLIIFFNKKYQNSYNLIIIITLANLFGTGTGITSLYFQQSKKMLANMIISITVAALIFILNFILIPKFHLYGAAVSLLIATFYAFIISYNYTKKYCYNVSLPLREYLILILILTSIYLTSSYITNNINFITIILIKFFIVSILLIFFYIKYKKQFFQLLNKTI